MMLFLTLLFSLCGSHDFNVWRGLTPLISTREDVERIVGKPSPGSTGKFGAFYKTPTEKVFVLYSSGACNEGWNVPALRVISITVEPDPKFAPSIESLKLEHFTKRPDAEILNRSNYVNETDGLSVSVDELNREVERIMYSPKKAQFNLKCSPQGANS